MTNSLKNLCLACDNSSRTFKHSHRPLILDRLGDRVMMKAKRERKGEKSRMSLVLNVGDRTVRGQMLVYL